MDNDQVQSWIDRFVEAWKSNSAATITELFSSDVSYRYHPYDEPILGVAAVVESWLADPDPPGSWEAVYHPFTVEGNRAVVRGHTRYFATAERPERVYHNVFLVEFDQSGRCRDFTEFYVREPGRQGD